jgi:peptidoglycan hydrolase-like protein with peptidoglycan-binding domain
MAGEKVPRLIELGSKGRDVRALKRALRRAGHLPKGVRISNVFDEATDKAVRDFQRASRLEVDGEVGDDTFGALWPHYDPWSRALVEAVRKKMRKLANPSGKRQRIVAAAFVGYSNRDRIHYTQDARRMQGVRDGIRVPRFPAFEDCSSFATWCYWVAGAPDPNGRGYDGFGFTGSQIGPGKKVAEPRPGDLVFYGWEPAPRNCPKHVAVYVGNGKVVSHGSDSGPNLAVLDYRTDRNQIRSYLP